MEESNDVGVDNMINIEKKRRRRKILVKKENDEKGKGVIYIRVSTQQQTGPNHVSLETQETMCREFAEKNKIELYENNKIIGVVDGLMKDEGMSGKYIEERGIITLLKFLNRGDIIIVYDSSRLIRNTMQALLLDEEFKNKGIKIKSVTQNFLSNEQESPENNLLKTVIYAMSQWEVEKISSRVKDAFNMKKQKKEHIGRVPFGYKIVDKILIEEPEEMEILKEIYVLRMTPIPKITKKEIKNKSMTYDEIATELNNRKYKTPNDKINPNKEKEVKKWCKETVRRLFKKFEEIAPEYKEELDLKIEKRKTEINKSFDLVNVLKDKIKNEKELLDVDLRKKIFNDYNVDIELLLSVKKEMKDVSDEIEIETIRDINEKEEKRKEKEENDRIFNLTNDIKEFIIACKKADVDDENIKMKISNKYDVNWNYELSIIEKNEKKI